MIFEAVAHFEQKDTQEKRSSGTTSALAFYPPQCIAVGKLKRVLTVPKGHLLASQGQDDWKNNLIEGGRDPCYRYRPVKKEAIIPLGKYPTCFSL